MESYQQQQQQQQREQRTVQHSDSLESYIKPIESIRNNGRSVSNPNLHYIHTKFRMNYPKSRYGLCVCRQRLCIE